MPDIVDPYNHTMRYALLSDIHANLPALDAVLADIVQCPDAEAIYHLGDLVGYAPWPNEVVGRIQEAAILGVAGNYDSTTATDYKHCGCRYENPQQEALSHESYEWTRAHVTPETKRYLATLPFRIDLHPLGGHHAGPKITLLHGNHVLNTVYVTEDRPDSFLAKIGTGVGANTGDVVCMGHTHIPWHRVVDGVHYVNTGSVGRPKDGDWRAGYVLLDVSHEEPVVTFKRVAYDVGAAMVNAAHGNALGPIGVSLAFGFVVLAMVYALGHLSGAHINPAVTVAFWSVGRFPGHEVIPYVFAQCVGAVLASVALRFVLGAVGQMGATVPTVPSGAAFSIEFLLSFVLMFVVMAAATDERVTTGFAPLTIGLTVAFCALVGGPLTGASMNPARSFGPALVGCLWSTHWLYWLAPLAGMVTAAHTYEYLRSAREEETMTGVEGDLA